MIVDKRTEFADGVAVAQTSDGDKQFGNTLNYGAGQDRLGDGTPLYVCFQTTNTTSGNTAGISFQLISGGAANSNGVITGSTTEIASTGLYTASELASENRIALPLPSGRTYGQYVGVQVKANGATFNGTVTAFITCEPPADYYPAREAQR